MAGLPHFGQTLALVETMFPQSGQVTSGNQTLLSAFVGLSRMDGTAASQ